MVRLIFFVPSSLMSRAFEFTVSSGNVYASSLRQILKAVIKGELEQRALKMI
jgi:hypothetical protein